MCMQNLKSVAFPVPEIIWGTRKNGQSLDTLTLLLFQNFSWAFIQMDPLNVGYWLNLKSVAFPVPELIGGTQKIGGVPGYAHAPSSFKFLMGFCSDGPSECTGQI